MALSKPRKDYLSDEMRIVLVGKTGAGKSTTGNTIIGREEFESLPSSTSVIQDCKHFALKRFGRNLQIVDSPGFHDTNMLEEERIKRIGQCVTQLSPGITAILYVVRIGRFTEEDDDCIKEFIKTFGSESKKFVIAVFTAADDLTEKYDISTFVQTSKVSLKTFLQEINNRFIVVSNRANTDEKERFVQQLMEKIEQLQRDNGCKYYSCTMLKDAESHLKKFEAEKLKMIEKRNREKDEEMIKEATAPYQAKLAEVKLEKEKQQALFAKRLAALEEDEKMKIKDLANYEAKLSEVQDKKTKQAALYAKSLAALKEDEKKRKEAVASYEAKLAEMKDYVKKQAALYAKNLAALKENEKKREEAVASYNAKLAQVKDDGKKQAALYAKNLAALKQDEKIRQETEEQQEALLHQLKVEKEKQEALYEEKLENLREEITERNSFEARKGSRDAAGVVLGGAVGAATGILANIVQFFKSI